jgi:hypothetical protein
MITVAYISTLLGKGTCHLSIITSMDLALISLFYIYTLGSYLKITIYPFEHRIIYYTFFDIYIINKQTDHIIIAAGIILWLALSLKGKAKFIAPLTYGGITLLAVATNYDALLNVVALISIPIVISFLLYHGFVSKKKNKEILNMHANFLLLNYFAIIGIVTGIIGVIISSTPLFAILPNSTHVRNYPYDIFVFFSSFSPALILLLISCLPIKLFTKEFMSGILKIKNNKIGSFSSNDGSIKSKPKIIYILLLIMLLSVVVGLVPHQPTVNRDNQQISVDTDYYVSWINVLMHSHGLPNFIEQAFVIQSHGDRPLTLIFLFTVAKIVNANLFIIVEHLSILLGPALILVVYFLTRELTSNDITSLLASFLTATSFQILIGIYAGFYANWFALIIGYTCFVFLIKFLKDPTNELNLVVFSVLIVLLLFTHVYTWSVLAIVMGVFLVTMLKLHYYCRRSIALLLLVVLSSVIIDVVRMTITGSAGGIEKDIEVAKTVGAGPEQFTLRWSNLSRTMYSYVGGQFSNFILLTLGLYWLFRSNLREPSNIFLMIYLSIGLIPFLLGDHTIQTRVFYDIPFQIPAAIALSFIRKQVIGSTMLLPICIWLIAMSIRSVSNFYLIFPS